MCNYVRELVTTGMVCAGRVGVCLALVAEVMGLTDEVTGPTAPPPAPVKLVGVKLQNWMISLTSVNYQL